MLMNESIFLKTLHKESINQRSGHWLHNTIDNNILTSDEKYLGNLL